MRSEYERVAEKILFATRNELYMTFPYMDVALCALPWEEGSEKTSLTATDGIRLWYNSAWVVNRYEQSREHLVRSYLHTIFHCMLRHLGKARGKDVNLWDIACDVAIASILNDLPTLRLTERSMPLARQFLAECAAEMKVVTAEGVYRKLLRMEMEESQIRTLRTAFQVDDHSLWIPEEENAPGDGENQDERWRDIAERAKTAMETMFTNDSGGGGSLQDQIEVAVREDVDYRAFLRRFAALHEEIAIDLDSFDPIYYTFGLSHYGNMPLVEAMETKEEKRIEDLVIAIDTSMSTSGELVHAFLACTYAILRSTETYTRKVNIHILQCDNKVRSDVAIADFEELHEYMKHFTLKGGDSTDFRPVFQYVDELVEAGSFHSLRGLIYFTDGMGFYPKKRPNYDTAFVFLGKPPEVIPVPPWAIQLVLESEDLYNTLTSVEEEAPELIDWDELPRT